MKSLTLAIDFDGTLCEHEYPNIGKPNDDMINKLILLKSYGVKLILWTCRCGKELKEAVDWCNKQGLYFDAVNDNLEEHTKSFGENSRKIFANYYIDDRNITIEEFLK